MASTARTVLLSVVLSLFLSLASTAFAEELSSNAVEAYEMRIARLERLLKDSEDKESTSKTASSSSGSSASSSKKDSDDDSDKEDDKDSEKSDNSKDSNKSDDSDKDDDDKKEDDDKDSDKDDDKKDGDDKDSDKDDDDKKEDDDKDSDKDDDNKKDDGDDKKDDDDDDKKDDDDDDKKDDDKKDDDDDDKDDDGKTKVKGDPHFTGADKSHFDFSGVPNTTYCLLTDSHIHINAHFGGYYGQYEGNPNKALTWMRKVGIMWGHHTFLFEAREGASWQYEDGYMARMEVDGDEVALSQAGEKAVFADGSATLTWEAARLASADDQIDVYVLEIAGVVVVRMELRPEVANLRTETDGTVHFDLQFEKSRLSSNAHGVLGQTYRPDHENRLSKQKLVYSELLRTKVVPGDNAEGFLDGSERLYRSSSMLLADCQVSRFARAIQLDPETSLAIEMSGEERPKAVGSSGLPRKMMLARAF